jgi:hypothetical protein
LYQVPPELVSIVVLPLPDTTRFNWKDSFYSKEKLETYRNANTHGVVRGAKKQRRPPK